MKEKTRDLLIYIIFMLFSVFSIIVIVEYEKYKQSIPKIDIPEKLIPLLKEEKIIDLTGTLKNDTLFINFLTDEDR